MVDAFRRVDEVLFNTVKGISDLINVAGLINVDFADVADHHGEPRHGVDGDGRGHRTESAVEAAHAAIHSPLLETSTSKARWGFSSTSRVARGSRFMRSTRRLRRLPRKRMKKEHHLRFGGGPGGRR